MDLFAGDRGPIAGIRLGTSGFSFPDWAGVFYPRGLARGRWLSYYATIFDALEINATYYRILSPSSTERMAASVPPGFVFTVKLHSGMTHERNAGEGDWKAFGEMLAPLSESGRLGPVLAQFPWSFQLSEESFGALENIRERLGSLPAAAEFRHRRWYVPEILERVVKTGFSPVSPDLPGLPGMPGPDVPVSGGFGYARLHGRNREKWWGGGPERYDYAYSPGEIREWAGRVSAMARKPGGVYVFFNNCHMGRAALDARTMRELLEENS